MPTLSQLSQMGGFNMRKKRPMTVSPPYMQSPTMVPPGTGGIKSPYTPDDTMGGMQTGGGDPYPPMPANGYPGGQAAWEASQDIIRSGYEPPPGFMYQPNIDGGAPNGPRLPPVIPPSAGSYNPAQPISSQPGGNGWGPQTATGPASGRGFGHSYVNPYPGMTGAERVAAKNAEIEAEMAANRAQRMQERQQNQAARQARGAIGEDGQPRGNWMDAALANNEGYQRMQGTFQPKAPTLPYGIPTDPAGFGQFLAGGNFDPNQARTLQQMLAQLKAMSSDGMPQEVRDAQQANIARLEAALAGYAPYQGMNPTFTP